MDEADQAMMAVLSLYPDKRWHELPDDVRSVVGYYNAGRIGLEKSARAVIALRKRLCQ